MVWPTASTKRGAFGSRRQVATPTKVVGEPTFHWFRLIQIVNTQGKTMTASTTTSAGTTNGQYEGGRHSRSPAAALAATEPASDVALTLSRCAPGSAGTARALSSAPLSGLHPRASR